MDVITAQSIPKLLPQAITLILHVAKRRLCVILPEHTEQGLGQVPFRECSEEDICGLLRNTSIPYRKFSGAPGFLMFQPIRHEATNPPRGIPSLKDVLQMRWVTATLYFPRNKVEIICWDNESRNSSSVFYFQDCTREILLAALRHTDQLHNECPAPGCIVITANR